MRQVAALWRVEGNPTDIMDVSHDFVTLVYGPKDYVSYVSRCMWPNNVLEVSRILFKPIANSMCPLT